MDRSLAGKVAIVTGAGPDIGRATAHGLASDGADLMLVARRPQPLEALAEQLADQTGRRVLAYPADIGDRSGHVALLDHCTSALGRVDGLVNIATAPATRSPINEIDWDDYLETVAFNVAATMNLCGRAATRMLALGGGSIVNIGTLSSSTMLAKMSAYTSSKAAMVVAAKTMAREVGPHGIRVNIVTPGFTTGSGLDSMFAQMAQRGGGDAEDLKARAARQAALHRHVDPDDIAEAVLFLISDRGRNVTGHELHVNAGQWIA